MIRDFRAASCGYCWEWHLLFTTFKHKCDELFVNQELFLILVKLIHYDFHLDDIVEMSLAHKKLWEFSRLLGY